MKKHVFKSDKDNVYKFDNVDLGSKKPKDQVNSYRQNLAKQLQELVESKEFDYLTELGEVIRKLRS